MSTKKEEYLPDIIQMTRKARIEAERRLLRSNALLSHATIYYACTTTLLTLVPLFFDISHGALRAIPFLSSFSAIVITLCSTYASAQNYGVRAEQMRESYLAMQELLFELDRIPNSAEPRPTDIDGISRRYIEILQRTENHLPIDYEIAEKNHRAIVCNYITNFFVRLLIYVAPVLASAAFALIIFG